MNQGIKEKVIVSTVTLAASLLAYWYARETRKDVVPYVMLGGFIGSLLGETVAEKVKEKKNLTDGLSIS